MDPAGDRLEVGDVERVRVEAPVPADDVEGVVGNDVDASGQPTRAASSMLDEDLDVALLDDPRRCRDPQVALAVRGVLEELPVAGQVALRRGDVARGLDDVQPQRLVVAHHPPVGGRPGHDDVVTGSHLEVAEDRLDGGGTGLDEHALVAGRVAVERRGLARDHVAEPHVGVAQHEPSAGHGVERLPLDPGHEVVQPQVTRQQGMVGSGPLVGQLPGPGVDDRRGQRAVVEQRGVRGEPLLPHELLGVQPAVGVAELGVPLARDVADALVVGHGCLLRCPATGCRAGPARARSPRRGP